MTEERKVTHTRWVSKKRSGTGPERTESSEDRGDGRPSGPICSSHPFPPSFPLGSPSHVVSFIVDQIPTARRGTGTNATNGGRIVFDL